MCFSQHSNNLCYTDTCVQQPPPAMLMYQILSAFCSVMHVPIICSGTDDLGFELLFTSNLREMHDVALTFDHPAPPWLRGTLVRNGLGSFSNGPRNFSHSFDAFAKLASWRFPGNNSVFFSTKFLRTHFYKDSMKEKTIAPYLLFQGVEPEFSQVEKFQALVRGIDNMNVNIYAFTDNKRNLTEYVALSDFWKYYVFYPRDLSTGGAVSAHVSTSSSGFGLLGFLNLLSSAHPLPEPGTGHHITFLSSVSVLPWTSSAISLIRIVSPTKRVTISRWNVDRVPYMHSFSVTENYAILFASPFYVNVKKMVLKAEPFDCLDWYPNRPTTVYVVELKTGKVTSLTTGNVFAMHHINAFETSDTGIILDVSAYTSPDFVKNLEMKVLTDPIKRNQFDALAQIKRYHISLATKKVRVETFKGPAYAPYTPNIDMPAINENYRARPYCYAYGIVLKKDNVTLSKIALVKKDLCKQNGDKVWYVPYHYPSEAWFVPNPRGKAEDDGVLMLPILDGVRRTTYLAVLDARTMELTNRADLPTVIPFSLHGRFFPEIY
ncbi:carotenoid isomerooxygenase-like [Haliotis rufescens]|uniref:carotenoid isomerooxygenase-like n=1 Tax=Haliotis rufescens TaxID=6454 RepID=UPI00201ECA39|nr:carotenoid isomerooxygenase-like [Haliotis rufescens]